MSGYTILAAILSLPATKPAEIKYVNRVVYRQHTVTQPNNGWKAWKEQTRTIELHHRCWVQGESVEEIRWNGCKWPEYERKGPYYLITIRTTEAVYQIKTRSMRYHETERRLMP